MKSKIVFVSTFLASMSTGYSIPTLSGKYNVTMSSGVLTDHSRNDRALMLSVFQPASCKSIVEVDYMPNATAAYQGPFLEKRFEIDIDLSPIFLEARLPVCQASKSRGERGRGCPDDDDLPILLSPGWSFPRGYYSVIASAIASEGFTVFTMDHPDEANIITYPDGHSVTTVTPEPQGLDDILPYLQPRIEDTIFILDSLSNATTMAQFLPSPGARPFKTDRVAMLGHSLGGVTAVYAAALDSRIRAAVDWDQQLFGPPLNSTLTTPILFMNRPNSTEPNWLDSWPQIQGPMLWVEVANTTHQTFSDAPILLKSAGIDPAPLVELMGSIDAEHALKMQTDYAVQWVKGAFTGKIGGPLLDGKEQDNFPEVTVIKRSGY